MPPIVAARGTIRAAPILVPTKLVQGACGIAILALAPAVTPSRSAPPTPTTATAATIERGRYLTHSVAMCVECHSPRDEHGTIIASREFEGAPNPFPAPYPGSWALRSVNLRSMARLDPEAVIRLLTDGVGRRGTPPDPPMPPFRLSREDATAIVAYLGSLR